MSTPTPPVSAVISAAGITKRFPGVTALSDVDFEVRSGEVHVLVGENGAGKSTLVKILAGIEIPDAGQLRLSDQPYHPQSPTDAIAAGVRVVHQELSLLGYLSVGENLLLEHLPRRRAWMVDYRRLWRDSRAMLNQVGLSVSPRVKVDELSIAQRQLLEIARALSAKSRLLILDEPTASLTSHETARLFDILDQLRADGVGIIYISHRLDEAFQIGDRVTVLRNGERVTTRPMAEMDATELVRLMVGRRLELMTPSTAAFGPELLRVEGLRTAALPGSISFSVRSGEILGMAGLVGAGRTETVRAIFGADALDGGRVEVNGQPVRIRHPHDAVMAGVSFVPEDRKRQGLLLEMSCAANTTLADLQKVARNGFLQPAAERRATARLIDTLQIKTPSVRFPTRNLSGGNQQKVLLARWLFRDSSVLIVDEPTRGVDVGARHEIYTLLASLAERGKAIVMLSSDMSELMTTCHRLLVFSRGEIVGELSREEFEQERILRLAFKGHLSSQASM